MKDVDGILVGDQGSPKDDEQETVEQETVEKGTADTKKEEQALLAGKYKSVEDLESAYSELNKKLGDQGNRLGKAEEDRSSLLKQLENMQIQSQEAPKDQEKADDLEAQLSDIATQIEEGDLSMGEGMRKTAIISAQIAQNNAVQTMQEQQTQERVAQSKQKFAAEEPEFFEAQKDGRLEQFKSNYPGFHDDVSAYYAMKADNAQSTMATAVEAARLEGIELGKQEMAKIAGGDKNTQKVLQSGGKTAETIGKKKGPMKPSDLRQSGLQALRAARGE